MRRHLIALALVASLPACATVPALSPGLTAPERVERLRTDYDALRGFVALFLPHLTESAAARIRRADEAVRVALAAAETAADAAARAAALKRAADALRAFRHTAGA